MSKLFEKQYAINEGKKNNLPTKKYYFLINKNKEKKLTYDLFGAEVVRFIQVGRVGLGIVIRQAFILLFLRATRFTGEHKD